MVGSFYDPVMDEGCAFEELISFHGGLGGPQTCPFLLHPAALPVTGGPIVGAAAVHDLLAGWRRLLEQESPPTIGEGQVAGDRAQDAEGTPHAVGGPGAY
jgi:hypothetical protein